MLPKPAEINPKDLSHDLVQGLGFRVQGLGFRLQGLGSEFIIKLSVVIPCDMPCSIPICSTNLAS